MVTAPVVSILNAVPLSAAPPRVVVPLTGSYTQMRDFLKRSLAEIPVLSLDQISLKRENRREGTVQAELRLTLHMVKS